MDKLTNYKKTVRSILEHYVATAKPHFADTEVYLVADDEHGQYLLFHNSWRDERRNYGCFLHVRMKNQKVYVESDGSDSGFTNDFLQAGIPKEDIVLAFQAPSKRPYSGFAVA